MSSETEMKDPTVGNDAAARAIRVLLFGAESHRLRTAVARHENLEVVDETPDVVVCFGGDGTLLAAEMQWPGLPKAPILNSRRGHRCIPQPPETVLERLAEGALHSNQYTKLSCELTTDGRHPGRVALTVLNEINVHMGRINSAVRFQLWIDGEAYEDGLEILGDGFVVCTPFGSTAYFNKITRGIFTKGLGIAFKATDEYVDHLVLPDTAHIRIQINRGPAVLAFDSAKEYHDLEEGDQLDLRRHPQGATILTTSPVKRLDEPF